MPSAAGYVRDYNQEMKTAKRRGEHRDNASRKRASRAKSCGPGMEVDHKDGNPQKQFTFEFKMPTSERQQVFKESGQCCKVRHL